MTGYTWVLLVWIAATLGGCCSGDPAATTAGRRQFIEAFNAEPSPCTLKGSGPEITQLAMTCEALPLERLRDRLQRACGAYQGVGFDQLTLIAQDGKTTCDLIDTRCNCP
ncbi:MAG: hypothetical protein AAFS10_02590 [Myxococcota bacterium]